MVSRRRREDLSRRTFLCAVMNAVAMPLVGCVAHTKVAERCPGPPEDFESASEFSPQTVLRVICKRAVHQRRIGFPTFHRI